MTCTLLSWRVFQWRSVKTLMSRCRILHIHLSQTGPLSLHHFQFVDVALSMRIPRTGRALYIGTYKYHLSFTPIGQPCRFGFKKAKRVVASTCLFHNCYSEVLGIFDSLGFIVMNLVLFGEGIPFGSDPYNLTLGWIKLYKTVLFPFLQFIKVFLEKGLVLFGADDPVDKRVVGRESCDRKNVLWHVVDVGQETSKVRRPFLVVILRWPQGI